ncbi:hypothetical protein [Synechococcus phage S-B68]|nr:hypothetical protein [Synechococcus phage S-B68]
MASPNYFSNFKNVRYALSSDHAGNLNYVNIKDFFRLLKVRDDIFAEDTLYTEYVVKDGERPEQIAFNEYGDEKYYYMILQINNITDFYNDWPLSQVEFDEYITKKYGSADAAGATRHYETVETIDSNGNLLLPGGLVVASDYIFYYPDGEGVTLSSLPVAVSYLQWEREANEAKAQIQILQPKYVYDYEREVKLFGRDSEEQVSEINISEVM